MSTQIPQSPHWIDKLIDDIIAWQKKHQLNLHVDDMKTPSGRVHTGALRGVVLHDLIAQTLQKKTNNVDSTYVFNDMDPMDGLPTYLDQATYLPHMGKPLYKIPAPDQKAKSYAEFYALDFIEAFRSLGCQQKIVWSHELYETGQMDGVIKTALDNVDTMRQIYQQVAEYELPDNWYPFQVICPNCGKVGTTLVTDWDGAAVTFECQPHKVEWAQGCGHQGKISPFGGNGKLLWKVDWPAHWKTMGVTVEGAGKDHTSAGGSRDMANAICQQIFNYPVPFDAPYEWILIRGAKMSSSKGVGTSAQEFVKLFPSEIGRFLFVANHYNKVIDFDPHTMSIPDLFDAYDQAARIFWQIEEGDTRLGRAFELSQLGSIPQPTFLPRFRDIATWMQHPEIDLMAEFAKIKGAALTPAELVELNLRKDFAHRWIDTYAPSEFQLTPKTDLPRAAQEMTTQQKEFFKQIVKLTLEKEWVEAELQQAIFDLAKASLGAKQGFASIYLALLGKKSGPRAAWLLLNTQPKLLQTRIDQLFN